MEEKSESAIIRYLPFLGSFIIFLGMTRLIFYYRDFGIKIVSFLEFSEIVTSFFDILIIVAVFGLFSLVQDFLMRNKLELVEKAQTRQKILDESNFWKRLVKYLKYLDTYIIGGVVFFVVHFIWSFFNKAITFQFLMLIPLLYVIGIAFIILIIEIDIKHKILNSSKLVRQFYGILMLCFFLSVLLMVMTSNEVKEVKDNKLYLGTTIIFNSDSTFVSDSSSYYIGKTQEYLFIYHEKSKSTDVIPISNVKQITFRQKNNR